MIARLCLAEKQVIYDLHDVDIHIKMEQFAPEYVAMQPNMTVPVLDCGGNIIALGNGGLSPFMYGINDSALQNNNKFTCKAPGTYMIHLVDANGCRDSVSIILDLPLPVELISFTGHAEKNYNMLEWITASEINNDYFTLEKSPDGIAFDTLATIDGAGNSNIVLNYSKTDEHPYPHISYYRLKQTDFNGNYKYSRIIPLLHSGNAVALEYTYNADADELTVFFIANDNRQKSVELIDAIGRKIYTATTQDAYMQINTAAYAKGVYFLTMKTGEETKTFKLEFR